MPPVRGAAGDLRVTSMARQLFATPWDSHEVAVALLRSPKSPFHYRQQDCVVPNASFGLGLDHEADLLLVSPRHWLTEVEIKVSRSDFRIDAEKEKWQLPGVSKRIKFFWYAMPARVWERCQDVWRAPGAGVVVVHEEVSLHGGWHRVEVVAEAEPNKEARKLNAGEVAKLGRLMSLRYWDFQR